MMGTYEVCYKVAESSMYPDLSGLDMSTKGVYLDTITIGKRTFEDAVFFKMSEGGDNLTYENLVIEVLQLIDEYSRKGVVLTVAKTADYRMKIPAAVNWVQQDLANSQKARLHKDLIIANATATYPTETEQALPADWLKINKVMQLLSNVYWVAFADYYLTTENFVYNSIYAENKPKTKHLVRAIT